MEGKERRNKILEILKKSDEPLSGTALAGMLKVSRQIIVQDIALLRATEKNILSTNKGYMFFEVDSQKMVRTFYVRHSNEQMEDELNLMVDNGGKVVDVVVEHEVYGQLTADLRISNRRDVSEFMNKIVSDRARPLNHLTDGYHYHTVEADSEEILDRIEEELKKKGYLISNE